MSEVPPVLTAGIGRGDQVEHLSRLASDPPHANLLIGPPGSGLDDVARRLIAAIICPDGGCGHCRTCTRVLSVMHPDVFEVEPEGASILVEQAREIVRRVNIAPIEAGRTIVLIHEIDRLNETAANKLLKTIEEPPDNTVIVGYTSSPEDVLLTIRSRCTAINLSPLAESDIAAVLSSEGLPDSIVAEAVNAASGSLDRARRLAGPYRELRTLALAIPSKLKAYGASAAHISTEITDAIDAAVNTLGEQHADDAQRLEADIAAAGYAPRVASAMRKSLENRQKRMLAQARSDALAEVFAGVLASVSRRLASQEVAGVAAEAWFAATDDAQRAAIETPSARTTLLLDAWLLRCPPLG